MSGCMHRFEAQARQLHSIAVVDDVCAGRRPSSVRGAGEDGQAWLRCGKCFVPSGMVGVEVRRQDGDENGALRLELVEDAGSVATVDRDGFA